MPANSGSISSRLLRSSQMRGISRSIVRGRSGELRFELLAGLDEALHGFDRFVELSALLRRQVELDDPLDALLPDHHGNADIDAFEAVFALDMGGAGEHALLVAEIGFGHRDGRRGRRIEGRAGLEQTDDLGAAVAGALGDLVEAVLLD